MARRVTVRSVEPSRSSSGRANNEWCETHDVPYQGSRGMTAPIRSSLVGSSYQLRVSLQRIREAAVDHALKDIMGIRR